MINGIEGFGFLHFILVPFHNGVCTLPASLFEDMTIWQITGGIMTFLFAAVLYSKENVFLLHMCYIIFWALIQLCTYKKEKPDWVF